MGYEYHLDFDSHILVVPEGRLTDDEVVDRINEDKPTIKIVEVGSEDSSAILTIPSYKPRRLEEVQ